ncbi:MAG: asparagine synthase-related protein [Cyanobacteria bacterium P01_H01_bin.162]
MPSEPAQSSWYLALGRSPQPLSNVTWQDEGLAIVGITPVVGGQDRWVVVGDVWLSDRDGLLQGLDIDSADWRGTDIDVVARCWERLGVAALQQLRGMFAIAIWDRHRQELWLIRDRVGARTLYTAQMGNICYIAPRLKTLNPWRSSQLDLVALRDYLCCAFVPGERTLWQDVRELRPGTYLQLPQGNASPYWQAPPPEWSDEAAPPLAWYGGQLLSQLEVVTKACLPTGQPVGVYLSGGLDSSCITALAAQFHQPPVHTYAIHFGAEYPNELAFSSMVAAHCQTQHHVLEITPQQLWQRLPETMSALDDPIGDPLTVPNLLLGQLARETVSVILNGEGGDPCFGGPKNKPMLLNSLYGQAATPESDNPLLTAYLNSFQKCASVLPQLLRPEVWQAVQAAPSVFAADLQATDAYLNRLMELNIKFKGADHILTKVNNLTQAAGLQGRSPLFDSRIVELSRQIPPAYKLAGANEKAVLKAAVADLLPASIVHRPKSGMMVPVQAWFYQLWNRQARSLLLNRRAAIAPYLNQALIRHWLSYRGDVWRRYGAKLWLLVSLEIWLQANSDNLRH